MALLTVRFKVTDQNYWKSSYRVGANDGKKNIGPITTWAYHGMGPKAVSDINTAHNFP